MVKEAHQNGTIIPIAEVQNFPQDLKNPQHSWIEKPRTRRFNDFVIAAKWTLRQKGGGAGSVTPVKLNKIDIEDGKVNIQI